MEVLAGSVVTCAYDANGNITEYVSGSGEILSHCDYSAFGRELIKTGSDDFTHRFSTKPLCHKTGMLEYQLRKYKPWCDRWINRDAIEEDGGLNLYGFVGNNPITFIDVKGDNPVAIGAAIGSAAAVAIMLWNHMRRMQETMKKADIDDLEDVTGKAIDCARDTIKAISEVTPYPDISDIIIDPIKPNVITPLIDPVFEKLK